MRFQINYDHSINSHDRQGSMSVGQWRASSWRGLDMASVIVIRAALACSSVQAESSGRLRIAYSVDELQ